MIAIEKWVGLITHAAPYSLPVGAGVTQLNLQAINPGQVRVRPGLNAGSFTAITAGTTAIRSAIRYPSDAGLVYQDASGAIRVGKGFS